MTFSELHPAYIAGLLDGEGWLGIKTSGRHGPDGKRYYVASIAVGMCDPTVPTLLHARYGGRLVTEARKGKERDLVKWIVTSKQVEPVLQEAVPYLIVKRVQAELLLRLREMSLPPTQARVSGYSIDQQKSMETLYAQIRNLNAKGRRISV